MLGAYELAGGEGADRGFMSDDLPNCGADAAVPVGEPSLALRVDEEPPLLAELSWMVIDAVLVACAETDDATAIYHQILCALDDVLQFFNGPPPVKGPDILDQLDEGCELIKRVVEAPAV